MVPADWMLAGVGGDRRQGYLRVDAPWAGGSAPALQVKWARRHIDLERKRAEYIRRLTSGKRRRWRRGGAWSGLEVTTDLRVVSKRAKPRKDILGYGWRGPQCGLGVLWNCEVCGRAVIAQVGWPIEEEGRETAQEVIESLEDHGVGGWDSWGVDGLAFLAPTEYELEGWRRMTRYLELRLLRKQDKLKVARWGMVPLVLGGRSLRDWYEESNRRRREVRWDSEAREVKGHEGVVAWGEARMLSVKRGARRAMHAVTRSARYAPRQFGAVAWHCPESNRLYLVEALYGGEGEALHGAVESVVCHEE